LILGHLKLAMFISMKAVKSILPILITIKHKSTEEKWERFSKKLKFL